MSDPVPAPRDPYTPTTDGPSRRKRSSAWWWIAALVLLIGLVVWDMRRTSTEEPPNASVPITDSSAIDKGPRDGD